MSIETAADLKLDLRAHEEYVAHSIPTPPDNERRREEARILLVEFLARRILAQLQGKEDIRKAA